MSLRGDDRGVVIQVGAVLLFAFVILAITMYQVQVVPDQNKEIEYNHNEQVQDQLLDVRSGILTTAGGGGSRSVSVSLGTNYPSRTIFMNPSPPSGKLRTVGTTNELINVTIANAKATSHETGDFWNGTNRSYSTGALIYEPFYHRYNNAPTTIYEHSLLVNQFDDVALAKTDQTIVRDDTITLVTLNGSYQEASTRTVALDTQSLSTSTETIQVANDGGALTLSLPTRFGNETWEPLLEPELDSNGGNVSDYEVLEHTNGPNTLIIELVSGTYTLQMAKVGVGSNTEKPPESAHYITSQDTNKSVQTGGTVSLTVEVRDRYNNPIEGETVTIQSPATPQTAKTGSDGQVTFTYDAPDTPINDEVRAHIDGNASEEERVVFTVNVTSPSGGGGSGGGAYTVDWRDPTYDNPNSGTVLSNCSGTSCTWDVGADNDASLNITAVLNESIGGLTVEFGVNNSSVGYVSPQDAQTDSNGEAQTDLFAQSNGTVAIFASSGGDSDRITITVENVTGGGGTNQPPTADFTYSPTNPNTSDSIAFDASASSDPDGSITSYDWDFGDGVTATGVTASHIYSSSGSYTVTLTVTDNDSATDTTTETITVTESDTAPPSITSFTATNPSSQDVRVTFDSNESLASIEVAISGAESGTLTTSDFTESGTGPYTYTATYAGSTDGTYTATLNTAEDAAGNDGASGQNDTVTVDTAGPTITSMTGPANATYSEGEILSFDVEYDEAVSVSGSPVIALDIDGDGDNESAAYVSGSGTKTLTFNYTVEAGDEDLDGIEIASTAISGGTLEDSDGNAADRNLSGNVPDLSAVLVDGVAPSVVDATIRNAPINESDTGTSQTVTVNFSEAMETTVTPTVEITNLSSSPYAVTNSSNGWVDATTWKGTVTLSDDNEETTATISVADAEDEAGNLQTPNPDTGNTFVVDTVAPRITDFQVTNPSGKNLTVTFNASEELEAINVTVVKEGSGTTVKTLHQSDFNETCSGGTCEYSATTTLSRGGFYNVTLQRATDTVGNEAGQKSTTLFVGGMRYNGDAAARDGPDTPSPDEAGGVTFSIRNQVGTEVAIENVTLDPADANINELDDQVGGGNDDPQEVEIFARPDGNPDSYSDWGTTNSDPEALPIDDAVTIAVGLDGDNTQSGNLPSLQRGNDLTFHLYEFYNGSSGEYDINDNVNMSGKNVTVTVEYTVSGTTRTDTFTITPTTPPTANFSYTPSYPAVGETVSFDASASSDPDGSIVSYQWDFGDGGTSTGETPSHNYSSSGTYTVTLTVTDDDGVSSTVTENVSVGNRPPVANFTWSCSGASCSFNASGSSDPDGIISSYSWDFGDGSAGSGETTTHPYSPPGTYTVTLTVTDNDGDSSTKSKTISTGGGIQFGQTTTTINGDSYVKQGLTSNRTDDVTIIAVKVNETRGEIKRLDADGTIYEEVELYNYTDLTGYAGVAGGYALPANISLSDDGSTALFLAGETQDLYLTQFVKQGGPGGGTQPVDMVGESITISITYRVNGVTYTTTKTVTVS